MTKYTSNDISFSDEDDNPSDADFCEESVGQSEIENNLSEDILVRLEALEEKCAKLEEENEKLRYVVLSLSPDFEFYFAPPYSEGRDEMKTELAKCHKSAIRNWQWVRRTRLRPSESGRITKPLISAILYRLTGPYGNGPIEIAGIVDADCGLGRGGKLTRDQRKRLTKLLKSDSRFEVGKPSEWAHTWVDRPHWKSNFVWLANKEPEWKRCTYHFEVGS